MRYNSHIVANQCHILEILTTNSASHKLLDVLLTFRSSRAEITIEDMSQQLNIPKSTVYRYVRILCEKGFLEKTGNGHYHLGLAFLELSRIALNNSRDIRLTALAGMKRVAESIKESVSLMRLFNRQAICIESIEGQHALRVTIERGRTQPLHAGASSKVLLAHLPETEWEFYLDMPLQRFTDTTITDFSQLVVELHQTRERGYGISDGEIDTGARAVAVPLRNGRGDVVAVLSVEGPRTRMVDTVIRQYVGLLQRESDIIRDELS